MKRKVIPKHHDLFASVQAACFNATFSTKITAARCEVLSAQIVRANNVIRYVLNIYFPGRTTCCLSGSVHRTAFNVLLCLSPNTQSHGCCNHATCQAKDQRQRTKAQRKRIQSLVVCSWPSQMFCPAAYEDARLTPGYEADILRDGAQRPNQKRLLESMSRLPAKKPRV
jgi:hypothetical protein